MPGTVASSDKCETKSVHNQSSHEGQKSSHSKRRTLEQPAKCHVLIDHNHVGCAGLSKHLVTKCRDLDVGFQRETYPLPGGRCEALHGADAAILLSTPSTGSPCQVRPSLVQCFLEVLKHPKHRSMGPLCWHSVKLRFFRFFGRLHVRLREVSRWSGFPKFPHRRCCAAAFVLGCFCKDFITFNSAAHLQEFRP